MQLSAFADGELPDNEKELLLRRLSQDPDMRRQVAEYLAIGRVMRGEAPIPGIETLRDRIAASLGALAPLEDAEPAPEADAGRAAGKRLARPAAGFATAAAVAVLAIGGMQYLAQPPEATPPAPALTAAEGGFSTQPAPDNLLDQYRLLHEAKAADSSMRTRLTSIPLRQEFATEVPGGEDSEDEVTAEPAAPALDDTAGGEGIGEAAEPAPGE